MLTKDKAVRRRRHELAAVLVARGRMFALTSGELTAQEMADIFLSNMLKLGRILMNHAPPLVAAVTKNAVQLLELPSTT